MALTTFVTLKASIANWLHRSDLTTVIPDFVALAEADIAKDLRIAAMESVASGTLTGETLAFPTRFVDARRLLVGGYEYLYESPGVYGEFSRQGETAYIYTIQGQNFYILNGASGDSYTLTYYAMFAGLSDDSDTNWLLTNHPEVYLFGSLRSAAIYLSDDNAMSKYSALYTAAISKLRTADRRASFSGGALTVRSDMAYINNP